MLLNLIFSCRQSHNQINAAPSVIQLHSAVSLGIFGCTGTHDLSLGNAGSNHRILTTSKHTFLSLLCSRAPSFLPLAGRSYAGCQCGCQPERFILWNRSVRPSHSEALLLQFYKTFATCDERKAPNHLTSGVETFFFFLFFRKCQIVSAEPYKAPHNIDVHLCDRSEPAHKGTVVDNKCTHFSNIHIIHN